MTTRILLCVALSAQLGCGTLLSGTRQDARVTITPADARVDLYSLAGEEVAATEDASTGQIDIPRPTKNLPYLAIVSAEGHCPVYQVTTVRNTAGYMAEALLLAIPFIQVIGFVTLQIDDRTGGCCSIEPIIVELEEGTCE